MIAESAKTKAEARSAGLMFYFTGVPCRNGHVDARYTISGMCRTCIKIKARERPWIPRAEARRRKSNVVKIKCVVA